MKHIRNLGLFRKKPNSSTTCQPKFEVKKETDKKAKEDPCKKIKKPKKAIHAPQCFFQDKIALVTGGSMGIGKACILEMLRSGLAGVTIADIDTKNGEKLCKDITSEFGNDKSIFVKTDVMSSKLVDWAFKCTLQKFNRIDLVVNNAGVMNDKKWENEISINLGGVVVGSLLGMQYMSKSCKGKGGTVVNVSSTFGINSLSGCPIHCMTQSGIIGFTRSLGYGNHFDRTGVRVMALCPGPTHTELMDNALMNCLNHHFACELKNELEILPVQEPCYVARGLIRMMCEGCNGSIWVVDNCQLPYEIDFPDIEEM